MKKFDYVSLEHKTILREYLNFVLQLIEDLSSDIRFQNYKDVLDIVIEYHNNYRKGTTKGNFYDFMMILPLQVSVMTNGYLAGLETKRNRGKLRGYQYLINEKTQRLIEKIEYIQIQSE
jgi:hypothetical protein